MLVVSVVFLVAPKPHILILYVPFILCLIIIQYSVVCNSDYPLPNFVRIYIALAKKGRFGR